MHLPCRYQEAYERDWRQKEKQARERAAAVNSDLAEAREAQRAATVSYAFCRRWIYCLGSWTKWRLCQPVKRLKAFGA